LIIYRKEYRKKNSEKNKKYQKEYREHKGDILLKQKKVYYKKNKQKILHIKMIYKRKRRKADPIFRLRLNISGSVRQSLISMNLSKRGRKWERIVGYTLRDLKEYIEKLFKPGMTWNNYCDWQLDHIIPVSFFKFKNTDDVEFRMCWRLDNLQPLWAKDNLKKSDKMILWGKEVRAKDYKLPVFSNPVDK